MMKKNNFLKKRILLKVWPETNVKSTMVISLNFRLPCFATQPYSISELELNNNYR